MAAPVIEAGAAYSGVSTGSINTTAPATVDADDIIVIVAQTHNTSGTVASTFGWPAGFTQMFALNIFNASGVARGYVGAAWKRADGSEDGATLNVTHNGATGAATHFGARTFRVTGCITTGNPYTQFVTNNPSNTNTIDFPAITTTGTEKSLLTMHVNSDNNGTIASLTGWTIIGVNGNNGTGSDGSNSAFKRENLAAGTYDPASPTVANTNATGWLTFQIEFEPPAVGGPVTLTPGLTTHTRQVYAAKLNPTLLASLITHARQIFSPELDETLLPTLLTHTRALYGAIVVPTLKPGLSTHTRAVYSPNISAPGATLLPGLTTHTRAIYSPRANASVVPTRIVHTRQLYAASVVSLHTLSPELISHARAIYSPSIGSLAALTPVRIEHARAIYGPTVAPQVRTGLIAHARLTFSPLVDDGTGPPPSIFASRHYNHGRHDR